VRGNGGAYNFEFGLRALNYELTASYGKVLSRTSVEVQFRYGLTRTRLQPIVGGGYSYIGLAPPPPGMTASSSSAALGIEAFAGLRADLVMGDKFGLSLLGLVTARYRTSDDSDPNAPLGVFPATLTLQLYYRVNSTR
jgi:outer membrane protein W